MEPETREASLLQRINQNNDGLIFLAIAGVPGAGKSTYSEKLCSKINSSLPDSAVIFPMDGFHYYRRELDLFDDPQLAHKRRGAPYTFNAKLFYETLLKVKADRCGWVPSFDHAEGDPKEASIEIKKENKIVIVEGLYLFLNSDSESEYWKKITDLFDIKWFLSLDLEAAKNRVVKRHMKEWNFTEEQATERWNENDFVNALLVLNNLSTLGIEIISNY